MKPPTTNHKARSESESGIHFIQTFKNCRRLGFFKYVLGWEPIEASPPLVLGGAFHDGKAVWYNTGSATEAIREYKASFSLYRERFSNSTEYIRLRSRGEIMLKTWIERHGRADLERYKILGVEEELSAVLPSGFRLTARLDARVKDTNGNVFILESKTGQFSFELTQKGVETHAQVTCQLYLARRKWPRLRILGVLPDIIYWHKSSSDPQAIDARRSGLVDRTARELQDFEAYTENNLAEIAQRVEAALSGKYKPIHVLDPNWDYCFSYHRMCPYWNLCRGEDYRFHSDDPPPGFQRTTWSEMNDLRRLFGGRKGRKS